MEISLQRKINAKTVSDKRKKMIAEESLHIDEEISLERFQDLYQKYGEGLGHKDFARYFLDIYYRQQNRLQCGESKKVRVLSKEFVSEEEILKIQDKIKENTTRNGLYYDEIVEMYDKFGGRLSLNLFAEEVLNVTVNALRNAKFKRNTEVQILKPIEYDRQIVKQIQNKVVNESGRHIDEEITLEDFKELYDKFGKGIDEKIFATKVLQIPAERFNQLGKRYKTTIIFSRYSVDPDYICGLREKIITEERLQIGIFSKEEFKRLYQKYAGILSEEVFAEEILDTTIIAINGDAEKSMILTNIEISDEYIEEVRKKIIIENQLEQNQYVTLQQIHELYEQYGFFVLPEKQFAVMVLEMTENTYMQLRRGDSERGGILKNQQITDFNELRKRVITENHLHYADLMEYGELQRLHKKYAPNLEEYIFAREILDILQPNYKSLKQNIVTHILLNERLPSNREIEKIKECVIKENKLHRKDRIDYQKFKEYHLKYGGIMPEDMFARRILDIDEQSLNKKLKKNGEAQILLHTEMSKEEIEALREKVIAENDIYRGKTITLEQFQSLYECYNHILSQNEFAQEVFSIDRINRLKNGTFQTIKVLNSPKRQKKKKISFTEEEIELLEKYLIQGLKEEEIAIKLSVSLPFIKKNMKKLYDEQRLSETQILYERIKLLVSQGQTLAQIKKIIGSQDKKVKKFYENCKLENRSQKILEDFADTGRNISTVKAYLDSCLEIFERNEFKKEKLDFLGECIEFVQGGAKYIEFFAKMCIVSREYEKANFFISANINNEGIKKEERLKLRELQQNITYAMNKEKAIHIIYEEGIEDVSQIMRRTNLSEATILQLKNSSKFALSKRNEERQRDE